MGSGLKSAAAIRLKTPFSNDFSRRFGGFATEKDSAPASASSPVGRGRPTNPPQRPDRK